MDNLVAVGARAATLDHEAQTLVAELIERLLLAEGPPVEPIPEVSEDRRREIVRSDKGRALAVAETWTTGPWRCLLIEAPSVAMGRPIFVPRRQLGNARFYTQADLRVLTDSRTQAAIRRVVAACRGLDISMPIGEGVVYAVFGATRTFAAWRPRQEHETYSRAVRGDVDNLAKTILDGLQAAGVVLNDRGVVRLTAAKPEPETWGVPPIPLEDAIREEVLKRRDQGQGLEAIRVELRLSRAHMERIVPEYRAPKRAVVRNPDRDAFLARQAVALILDGRPYKEARRETGAPAAELRAQLATALRPSVVQGELTLEALARRLAVDLRTAARVFAGDRMALDALKARKPTSQKETREALARALGDVLHRGLSITAAARVHKVSPGSLRSKVGRARGSTTKGHG